VCTPDRRYADNAHEFARTIRRRTQTQPRGAPDTSVPRAEAVTRADNHAFAADLAQHTQTGTATNNTHVFLLPMCSQPPHWVCPAVATDPESRTRRTVHPAHAHETGSPYVMPPAQWHCTCNGHGGPHHSAYVERAAEASVEDDHQATSFAMDPCHGLLCRRRWKRVTKRHDSIRGTQRYVDQGSGTTPGLAAEAYAAVKAAKYADQDHFIPFILETGGRVNKAVRDWLDNITLPEPGEQVPSQDAVEPAGATTTETILREAMQALVRVQAHMLARIVVEIRSADLAVELEP
jgi:hypothetical protein